MAQALTKKPIVFHADLSDAHEGEDYFLAHRGKRIRMIRHTAESLAAVTGEAPHLLSAEDAQTVTHYSEVGLAMPADLVSRVHLRHTMRTFEGSHGSEGVSHSALFIPPSEEEMAGGDAFHYGRIDYTSTAKHLLFHHPDLVTQDKKAANTIYGLMDSANIATEINRLALVMRTLGQPTEDSGWAHLVPFVKKSEESNYSPKAAGTYRQHPTDQVQQQAAAPLSLLLVASNNTARLENVKWSVQKGQAVESGDGNQQLVKFADLLAGRGGASGDDWKATLSNTGQVHQLEYEVKVTDADKQEVEVTFNNYAYRYLGLYVRFWDAQGNAMSVPNWKPTSPSIARDLIVEAFDNQYDDMRFLGFVSPNNSVFAVPVPPPGDASSTFRFPVGAVSATLYGSGLGTGADLWPRSPAFGGIMTAVFNLGVPTFFLGFGVAAQTYKPLYDILNTLAKNKKFLVAGALLIAGYIGGTSAANRKFNWSGATSVIKFLFDKLCTKALLWVEAELAAGEIEDEIPFAGWIMLTINILATTAQLAETIVSIATAPWNIENTLALSITTTVDLHPDPRNKVFPQGTGRKYVVKMIYKNESRPTRSYDHDVADNSTAKVLQAVFDDNTLGGEVKLEADFYVGDWLAGKATTGWLANDEQTIASQTLYLVEYPVPLDDKSVYQHEQILVYQGGKYEWFADQTPPTKTIQNRDTSKSGNALGGWTGITISQRKGMVGFAWQAAGMGISQCGSSGSSGQLYAFQNVAIPGSANLAVKFPSCGFAGKSRLVYDPYPPKFLMKNGNWVLGPDGNPEPDPTDVALGDYYVDPRPSSAPVEQGGGFHLRKVVLDGGTPFDMKASQPSFGRFPLFPDSMALHPSAQVVAVNSANKKLMVAPLVEGGAKDVDVPVAQFSSGPARDPSRPGLMFYPVAVTCAYDGTILVLEDASSDPTGSGTKTARISAFDLFMNPVQRFFDAQVKPSFWLYLSDAQGAKYLDLRAVGDERLTYMYVLYYKGTGSSPSDYRMAIYTYGKTPPKSNPLVTTPGISAAGIAVDMWHSVYTQNFGMVTDESGKPAGPSGAGTGPDGRTVPSVSLWLPPTPTGGAPDADARRADRTKGRKR